MKDTFLQKVLSCMHSFETANYRLGLHAQCPTFEKTGDAPDALAHPDGKSVGFLSLGFVLGPQCSPFGSGISEQQSPRQHLMYRSKAN